MSGGAMITRRVGGAADATPGEAGARRGHGIAKSPSGDSSPRRVRGCAQRKSNLPAQVEQYMRHPGDFLVDGKYLFEIDGSGKGFRQIKAVPDSYVAADDIETGIGNKIPLWLFGFLY